MKKAIIGLFLVVSTIVLVACGGSKSSIIISKYIQNDIDFYDNQAIELYNVSKGTINLRKYSFNIYSNGEDDINSPDYEVQLTGEIKSKETFLIVHSGASEELLELADLVSKDLVFDGNDVIHLRHGKKVIDLVHDLGDRTDNFKDEIYVRKDTITKGNRTIEMGGHKNSEWDFYIPNFYKVIGSHPVLHPEVPKFRENTAIINPDAPEKDQYPETVLTGGVIGINDGDTASFLPDYSGDARVRFLGINTPELDHSGGKHEKWAPEARDSLQEMLKWQESEKAVIYLQFEASGKNDNYGRTLAYVWSDGLFTNYEQVLKGFTRVSGANKASSKAYDDQGIYLFRWLHRAENYARDNRLGLWS